MSIPAKEGQNPAQHASALQVAAQLLKQEPQAISKTPSKTPSLAQQVETDLYAQVKAQALCYLHIAPERLDAQTDALLTECYALLQATSAPRFMSQVYPLTTQPLAAEGISLDYPALAALLQGCHSVCVVGATLGIGVERQAKLLSKTDMAKLVVFDALASSYLEVQCDQYEATLAFGGAPRTFRFCPGYGDVPLSLNATLCRALQMEKQIGLTVQPSMLLLPQKSMIGLIGLGAEGAKKTCDGCPRITNCDYRKKEQRCYKT